MDEGRQIDEQNTQRRARILGLGYENLSDRDVQLYMELLTVDELYSLKIVPVYADAHNIRFGITNTTSQSTMQQLLQRFADQRVTFVMISDSSYRDMMRRYDPPKQVVYQDIALNSMSDSEQLSAVSATLSQVRADDMLAYLVQQAYRLQASDIHLETEEDEVRIRLRVDGVLHPIATLAHDKYKQLISSLAVAANISTTAADTQTGHANQDYTMADGTKVTVNARVETVPTLYGMDVVMRLFTLNTDLMSLDKLDLNNDERAIIDDIISHPTGLVLIVGPTGSGKTTTLYSIINELNHPERKIITLEDPIEYQVRGVTQIPIDSHAHDQGFATAFRAVLRLDPDVIMVGEIRDQDTARTALQSALTGHLVLSTYHAGSAAAALTRLLDSAGDNPLFMSAVRLVQAQRLVRRLDPNTREAYTPDEQTKAWVRQVIESLPAHIERPNVDNAQLYRPGTSPDNPFGYKGQVALRELLIMTPAVQHEIQKGMLHTTTDSIAAAAVADGMVTMLQDGVLRALQGQTTIEEVMRVVV